MRGYIIDGHNRHAIAETHGLDFDTKEYQFSNEIEVKLWMIDNQKGRRNLSDFVKYELAQVKAGILKEKGRDKMALGGGKFKPSKQGLSIMDKPSTAEASHNTRDEIATELNWSPTKVARADVVNKRADDETKEKLRRNEVSINQVYQDFKKKDKQRQLAAKKEEYTEQQWQRLLFHPSLPTKMLASNLKISYLTDNPHLPFFRLKSTNGSNV